MIKKLKSLTFFSLKELRELLISRLKRTKSELTYSRVLIHRLLIQGHQISSDRDNLIIENFNGWKLYIRKNSSDSFVFQQIFIDKEYQPVVDFIESKRIKINTIVDCGANIGYSTLYLSRFFPAASIISIEPDSGNMEMVKKNTEANLLKNLIYIEKGVWHKHAWLQLRTDFRDGSNWSRSLHEVSDPTLADTEALSLPEIMQTNNLESIDLLKIDIEGAERYLFQDHNIAREFLSKTKCLAIEIHDEYNIRENIYHILTSAGFEFVESGELTIAYKRDNHFGDS
jgi:FkbM family methyltransferase